MSALVNLVCNRVHCPARFQSGPERGFATLAETRSDARAAGWKVRRSDAARRFDQDFCPDHDSVLAMMDKADKEET